MNFDRVHAEINLDNLLFNVKSMQKVLPDSTGIMAVIKADAYGNGAEVIAEILEKEPKIAGFCTATFEEAIELRNNNIKKPILVLGYVFEEDYEKMAELDIRPAVYSFYMAKEISDAAVRVNKKAKIHIKVDTGMGRIGFLPDDDSISEIEKIAALPNIELEGIFTHFSRVDEKDKSFADIQQERFDTFIDKLHDKGIDFTYSHSANSAAIMEYDKAYSRLVRAGITLYGMWPSDEVNHDFPLKPLMTIKAAVINVKTVGPGFTVGYGSTFVTDKESRIATISIGYADGMPRSLSNKGYVLLHGKKAPIIGRICMDQLMVDVSDIPDVKILDQATIIGQDGNLSISMEEAGNLSNRFNYELSCGFGNRRIPRIYYLNGNEYKRTEFM